ncbi:putative zinc finger protein [Orchesella cincta]|uniref:Putative zinc finger protein n=1 Tax=Orchesella cincta TaxID=48709 RepID=A0A1D2MXN2_ORCCI|nr:putative zinc finger protein [Orchesella cincta]
MATSERYVSLVTQWGTKLSEAIKKLRQQENLISSLKREKFVLFEQVAAAEATAREQFDEERGVLLVRHQEEEEKLRNDYNHQISSLQRLANQLTEEKAELEKKVLRFQNLASKNGEEMSLLRVQKLEDEEKLQKYYKKKISLLQMQLKLAEAKATSSNLELSTLQLKVGKLEKKVVSLESELGKTKKGKNDVEMELLQRMKAEMDKLEETFATLDSHKDEETVAEQPPVLESELEAVQEHSRHWSISNEHEDIIDVESNRTDISDDTNSDPSMDNDEHMDSDDDVAFICEMPEKTSTPKDSAVDPRPNTPGRRECQHAEDISNSGGLYFQCICKRKFSTKGRLATHLRYYQERKFMCRICKRKFHRFSVWRTHMSVKHDENNEGNFGCSNCGVAFSTKAQFHQHRRVFHTSKKEKGSRLDSQCFMNSDL